MALTQVKISLKHDAESRKNVVSKFEKKVAVVNERTSITSTPHEVQVMGTYSVHFCNRT